MKERKDRTRRRERGWRKMMGGGEGGAEGRQALSLFARRRNQQQDNGLSTLRLLTDTGLFLTTGTQGMVDDAYSWRFLSSLCGLTCASLLFVCERAEAAGRKRRSAADRQPAGPVVRLPPGLKPATDTL